MVIGAQLLVYSQLLGSRPMPSLVLTLQLLLRILLILLYHNQEISLVISQEWAPHLSIKPYFKVNYLMVLKLAKIRTTQSTQSELL